MKTVVYHTGHSTFNLHVHPVFVTKYRRKIFTAQILTELKVIFETVCCGAMLCGVRLMLLLPVEVLLFPLSDST